MSLSGKKILCLTDNAETKAFVTATLTPLVKFVVFAVSDADGMSKLNNSEFDCILLRTNLPTLDEPKKLFQLTKVHKVYKTLPWIVLGKDIEKEDHIIQYRSLKFLENPKDGPALIKMLEGLLFTPDSSAAAIDVNFLNPFVQAVVTVIESMSQVQLTRGTPFVRKTGAGQAASYGDVSGLIGMNSDRFMGSMAICYQEGLILRIVTNMLGNPVREINDDVKDAVAELTNIIFGHAKRDLNAVGHTIQPAIPSVVTGKNHEIRHSVDGICLVVPFEANAGKLVVECVMRPRL
jgi:chemotaxis protein CheX